MIHLVLHLQEEAILGGPNRNTILINSEHLQEIKQKYPDGDHDRLHRKNFRSWFHKKIYDLHKLGSLDNGDELLALASGSDHLSTFYQGCIVNGVRFIAHDRDKKRTTQNSGVSAAGTEGFNFYGTLEEVVILSFTGAYSVALFRCKWFNTNPRMKKTVIENNVTSINVNGEWYKDEPYILATQAKQVFYLDDLLRGRDWKVVEDVNHRQIWDIKDNSDEVNDVIDVVHETSSSNFLLTVDLGELIMQSDQPAAYVGADEDGDDEADMSEHEDVADAEDELVVELCEDENVSPITDGNDSDYSV
ncbi:uncharacterized protein LOC133823844 [Humulus lupulus]|uniref:uncharacterized protein LOC133823844 n=1 Tax=Humulus lupulus TaxID=3486 RepID=UPI002B40ED35|nr:uncharacterized protein LOC133823844 [Humulus lupulus]